MHAITIFFLGWLNTDINCCHHPANLWLIRRVPDGQVSQSHIGE